MRFRSGVLLLLAMAASLVYAQELDHYRFDWTVELRRTSEFRESIANALMMLPGVEGVAISIDRNRPRVAVYVNESVPQIGLKAVFDLANRRGINVEVVPVGEFEALQVLMGSSTGGIDACGAGTLGMAVRRGNQHGYLTNAHVAAVQVDKQVCPNGRKDQPQVAPGRADLSCGSSSTIGKLIDATHIPEDGVTPGTVDAAFVEASAAAVDRRNACGVCPSDLSDIDPRQAAKDKRAVVACGRGDGGSPEKRSGKVSHIEADLWVRYNCLGARVRFKNQIMVEMDAPKGYSGAVAFGVDNGVLGLIFAGNGTLTAVNPIREVLTALSLDTKPCQ
jgi:hypothetical protein